MGYFQIIGSQNRFIQFLSKQNSQMSEFSKAYCQLHPHQLMTNFCIKQECLVGLCANCICTHTQQHVLKGTSPNYQNIRTTCKKMQDNIQSQIQEFDEKKERILRICDKVKEKRYKLNELVDIARTQAIQILQAYFEERRDKLLREIEAQQKQAGLHCQNRLQSLLNVISRETSGLIYSLDDLNSTNFIQSLPRIRSHTLVNAQIIHNEIKNEVEQNENFKTCIRFNQNLLPSISGFVETLVTISFTVDGKNSHIKAENHPLRSSRANSNDREGMNINISKNPSITFRLQQSGGAKKNSQSQVNINPSGYTQTTFSKKEWNKQSEKNFQNFYRPSSPHTTQITQTQKSFKYPNFLSEVPRPYEFVNPLGPSNYQPTISRSRAQQKISVSKINISTNKTIINEQRPDQSFAGQRNTPNLGKKSKKGGLRVIQNHENDTEFSRQYSNNDKFAFSRGALA